MKRSNTINGLFSAITNKFTLLLFLSIVLLLVILDGSMNNDEGMWSYIGRVWVENNISPYVGAVENKTPGIFELFAVSHILFGTNFIFLRLLGVIAILFSSLIVYLTAEKLHSPSAGIFSMTIFGLTMSWYLLDGAATAHTETFMVLFSTLSFYLVIKGEGSGYWKLWIFLAGFSMGLAIAFKQIALTTAMALLIFFFVYHELHSTTKKRLAGLCIITLGMITATLFSLVPLLISKVTLKEYFDGAWLILLNPGSSADIIHRAVGFFNTWINSRIVFFYPFFILLIFQTELRRKKYFMGFMVWMLCDFVGVNSSGAYYGHQIKQIVPSVSLIIGISLSNFLTNRVNEKMIPPGRFFTLMMFLIILLLPYKQFAVNIYNVMSGYSENKIRLATYLREGTKEDDYIYIAGCDGNTILSYSGRISSSKYFNTIFVTGNSEKKALLSDLKDKPPFYLLSPPDIMPELEKFLVDDYVLLSSKKGCSGFNIFRLKNKR